MINILVVEDDEKTLKFCSDLLLFMEDEINVFRAADAETALEIFCQNAIDGAFVDIKLPHKDGFSLVTQIREMDRYHLIPIIFASGVFEERSEIYKQFHNIDFITKPITRGLFRKVCEKMIAEISIQKRIIQNSDERVYIFDHNREKTAVPFSDILFATVIDRKLKIVTRKKIIYKSQYSLEQLIIDIGSKMFARCSNSYAVNVENIESIESYLGKSWTINFRDADIDEEILLSINYKKNIYDLFTQANKRKGMQGIDS